MATGRKNDWTGALTIATGGLATAYYNDSLKKKGGDSAGASALEALASGIVVGLSGGYGPLFNVAAGVLGGAAASLIFGG